jgi:type I restriction enzyme S subunit
MNDQIEITFGEIGRAITGKTPSSDDPEDFGEGYPFVTPTDSLDSKYVLHTARQLSDEGLRKLKSKALPPDSILVSCIGSAMGKVVMNSTTCITNQQFNSIIVDTARFCPHYVYYALRNSYKLLRNAASGSTALPMLNKTDFEKLKIRVFRDKDQQRKIAAVLSALDAKIALNHRINVELEGMAKLLYDYWFVQYDFPLSAAQAAALGKPDLTGQPYRSSGGPMVFDPQLKREIPKGWEVGSLSELCHLNHRTWPNKDHPDQVTYLDLANAKNGEILSVQNFEWDEAPSRARRILTPGDTIFGTVRPGNRTFALVPNSEEILTGSTGFAVLTPKTAIYREFNYLSLTSESNISRLTTVASGAAYPAVNPEVVAAQTIALPNSELIQQFHKTTASFFDLIERHRAQNQELTTLRDWLLPMLMNGQVRVG